METALPTILGALVAALGTYIVAVRRFSGKVGSSEASELWKESSALRQWTSDQMKEQARLITELRERLSGLEGRNEILMREKSDLVVRVEACEELQRKFDQLTEELREARQRPTDLGGGSA